MSTLHGYLPHTEFIESRRRPKPVPIVDVDGVTKHAQQRAHQRLGVRLPESTWQSIIDGVKADLWGWEHRNGGRIYYVPVEVQTRGFMLPVAVQYVLDEPMITTVFSLLRG
jgi:hypothetical protein